MVERKVYSYTNIQMDPDNFSMTSVWPWQDMPDDDAVKKLIGMKIEKAVVHDGALILQLRDAKMAFSEITLLKVKAADELSDVQVQGIKIKTGRAAAIKKYLDHFTEYTADEEFIQE